MKVTVMRPVEILLVEDSPSDAELMLEALDALQVQQSLSIVVDGVFAMEFLRRQGAYANAPRPDLILLDLNLPRKDGREVLAEIKADCELQRIPVIVLTTSLAEKDIQQAYKLHTNCYIVKPMVFKDFLTVVESINYFWFNIAKLPTNFG